MRKPPARGWIPPTCSATPPILPAGPLATSSDGDTIVNINAGAGITGGASFGIFSNDNLTIHHNDPAGITNTLPAGIEISQHPFSTGAISYTGSADVTGGAAGFGVFSDGRITITQTAGTITATTSSGFGIYIPTPAAVNPDRSININTVGAPIVAPGGGIFIRTEGAQSDVTIATGAITTDPAQNGNAISVDMGLSTATGRNLSVTTNGAVVGNIFLRPAGIGTVDVTTNALVTGDIYLRAGNTANTNAFTVNLNQDVAGDVILQNSGTGTTTVRTRNITGGTLAFTGGGANSSLVVDGTITRTGIADFQFGGSLASVSLVRGGTNTATFNGAISGTFDTTASLLAPANSNFAFGLDCRVGKHIRRRFGDAECEWIDHGHRHRQARRPRECERGVGQQRWGGAGRFQPARRGVGDIDQRHGLDSPGHLAPRKAATARSG